MNIQSNWGLQAFQSASRLAPESRASAQPASGSTPLSTAVQGPSDTVTISKDAMALAASTPARTHAQERFLQTLQDNTPAQSEKLAHEMAYSRSQISYDISHGDIRLSSTGEVVGEGYAARFEQLAAAVDAQKRALYEAEKAKGTAPNDIIAKIFDFQNAQSEAYRVGTGIGFV